jgi:two-component system, cell cycle sensor histidine kinase and response regulator CckA
MSAPSMDRHPMPAVLVVDDEEALRVLTRRILEDAGYHVWEAADGLQALGFLTQGVVDIVVTDIRMPRMDGWQLASHLAMMTPRLPILFLSGYDAHIGTRTLPGPVLAKPFTPEALLASLRDLLWGPQPRSA